MTTAKEKILIHTDGGSRGNPGPSAIGVVIQIVDGTPAAIIKEYGEYIGHATNNEAEYQAVIFALKKIKQLIGKEKAKKSRIEIHLDSELVERQINGHYKIENTKIQKLFLELWNLKVDFDDVTFKHVLREKNKEADKLVNAVLDKETNKLL